MILTSTLYSITNFLIVGALQLNPGQANCGDNTSACDTGLPVVSAGHAEVQQISTIVFGIIAALAVLMIVISGFRFITGQGNPQEISKARSTIVYAVLGLVFAIISEAIVSLVLSKL